MNCVICKHGVTRPALVSVTLECGASAIVFRSVPADVCDNCAEPYLADATARALFVQAEAACNAGVELEIRPFRAA